MEIIDFRCKKCNCPYSIKKMNKSEVNKCWKESAMIILFQIILILVGIGMGLTMRL